MHNQSLNSNLNFIFYYTFSRNFELSILSNQENSDFTKDFIFIAKKICELEAQTFLNDESKEDLKRLQEILQSKIDHFIRVSSRGFVSPRGLTTGSIKKPLDPAPSRDDTSLRDDSQWTSKQWRIFIGLLCTFEEWCRETNFFNLDKVQQDFIFSENPVDGYYKNYEYFKE